MSTRLYLIRHGVTASNEEGRYMGRSEEPLSTEGRWQARLVARELSHAPLEAVYSSPLRRARETASTINQPHGHDLAIEHGFIELDLGRWEGMSGPEISAQDPAEWKIWMGDPAALRLDGIEAFGAVQERVRKALHRIVRLHPDGCVAAVTHDGIIRIAVLEALGMSLQHYRSIPIDNTGVTVLDFSEDRNYLRQLNSTGHLDGARSGDAARGPADR